jgi:hypothetical protein
MKGREMRRYALIMLVLSLYTVSARHMMSEIPNEMAGNRAGDAMTIVVRELEMSQERLVLDFDIRNDSEEDLWFCNNIYGVSGFEVFLEGDGYTLMLRRRLDVPTNRTSYARIKGQYVRLVPGETQRQSVSLNLPAGPDVVFADVLPGEGAQELKRLVLEIGFYAEDLPGLARGVLLEAARFSATSDAIDPEIVERYFSGFLIETEFRGLEGFEESNRDSDLSKEVVIPYTYQALKGECCARFVVDGIAVPYEYEGPAY